MYNIVPNEPTNKKIQTSVSVENGPVHILVK